MSFKEISWIEGESKFMDEGPDVKKLAVGLVVGVVILGGVIYAGYLYSQKYGTGLTLPNGQTYTGQKAGETNPPTAPQRFTAGAEVKWKEFKGKVYSYSFSYPETLNLGVFPNDPTDSVAIIWGNIPAQNNILLNVENIADRSQEFVGKPEEYVRNWWRFFPGLTGVKTVEKFTNTSGMAGYRAIYVNKAGQSPNLDIFLIIPGESGRMIHIANGVLDPELLNRLIDSVKYSQSPQASPSPLP